MRRYPGTTFEAKPIYSFSLGRVRDEKKLLRDKIDGAESVVAFLDTSVLSLAGSGCLTLATDVGVAATRGCWVRTEDEFASVSCTMSWRAQTPLPPPTYINAPQPGPTIYNAYGQPYESSDSIQPPSNWTGFLAANRLNLNGEGDATLSRLATGEWACNDAPITIDDLRRNRLNQIRSEFERNFVEWLTEHGADLSSGDNEAVDLFCLAPDLFGLAPEIRLRALRTWLRALFSRTLAAFRSYLAEKILRFKKRERLLDRVEEMLLAFASRVLSFQFAVVQAAWFFRHGSHPPEDIIAGQRDVNVSGRIPAFA